MDVIGNILGKKYKKNDWDSDGVKNRKDCQPRNPMRQDSLGYRRVHKEGQIGICEMCGKKGKLYDDLCKECRK